MTEQNHNETKGTCNKSDCTVATTGKCLESHASLKECPHFVVETPASAPLDSELSSKTPAVTSPSPTESRQAEGLSKVGRKFHPGSELGLDDAAEIMRSRYFHLIGVVGQTDAGKTAFLSALYLMSSQGLLRPQYSFAGSLTLQGFEDRVRRVRRWEKTGLPKEFMAHTQLPNPRSPSFMHLSLKEDEGQGRSIELLMTDLPGEWTTELINRLETASRFRFLGRADAVVYVLDGPLLANRDSQHQEAHKAKLMLERLRKTPLVSINTPLVLLISKCDELGMNIPPALSEIVEETKALNFEPEVILSSCFSRFPKQVESGTGVKQVIDFVLTVHKTTDRKSFDFENLRYGRAFGRFRQRPK